MNISLEMDKRSLLEQKQHQESQLVELLNYLNAHSPFYQQKFKNENIQLSKICLLEDLQLLSTTTKEDLQLHQEKFLCVPKEQVSEYASTSGTLGSPVSIALTANDLNRLALNEKLSFQLMGVTEKDIVQLMLTLDRQFMAGVAYYFGAKEIGAAVVRTGPGLPSMQVETALRLGTTSAVAVPSFLLKLIEYAKTIKFDLNQLPITKVLCIGESVRETDFSLSTLGKHILDQWPIKLFSTYASTEMQTAFTECEYGVGGHHQPDLIILEILDEDGNQLPDGQFGEVTITTLGVEAMPLLRYRTGDICCVYSEPCACGRTTKRLSPVKGRKQQMIKYKGTTLYPPAIFDMLNHFTEIKEYVIEVYTGELGTDELILHICTHLPLDDIEKRLKPFLQSRLRVVPEINYCSTAEIHEMQFAQASRKPIRFKDQRVSNE